MKKSSRIKTLLFITMILFTACEKEIIQTDLYGIWKGSASNEHIGSGGWANYREDYIQIDLRKDGSAQAIYNDKDSIFYYWEFLDQRIYLVDTTMGRASVSYGSGKALRFDIILNEANRQVWKQVIKTQYYDEYIEWDLSQ